MFWPAFSLDNIVDQNFLEEFPDLKSMLAKKIQFISDFNSNLSSSLLFQWMSKNSLPFPEKQHVTTGKEKCAKLTMGWFNKEHLVVSNCNTVVRFTTQTNFFFNYTIYFRVVVINRLFLTEALIINTYSFASEIIGIWSH